MADLPISNPARMLAMYGGIFGLICIETDRFRREAPFLNSLPSLLLAIFTLTLRMKRSTKLLTGSSFVLLAFGVYMYTNQRRSQLHLICSIFTAAHIVYLLSYVTCVRRLWHGCAIFITTYMVSLIYFCFADIFLSIPVMVLPLVLHIAAIGASVIAAGSVWRCGSKRVDAHEAALLRFFGLLSSLTCSSVLIINQFGYRIDKSHLACSLSFYIAQPLLFFANERAF